MDEGVKMELILFFKNITYEMIKKYQVEITHLYKILILFTKKDIGPFQNKERRFLLIIYFFFKCQT